MWLSTSSNFKLIFVLKTQHFVWFEVEEERKQGREKIGNERGES